jgi:hypothetical protein
VVNLKSKIKNQKSSRFPPSAGSGVNQKSKIKNPVVHIPQIISRTPVQDRGSIKNQKLKTQSSTSPKSFRGRQCRIGGQSKIKNQKPSRPHPPNHFADASAGSVVNQKSKIKNQKSSRFPPSAGSVVNQKSQIKNPVVHIPQIVSIPPVQDPSSI